MRIKLIFKNALVLIVASLFVGCMCGKKSRTLTYMNPIINEYLADPCMVYQSGNYYLFATGQAKDGRGIQIYKSPDLAEWTPIGGAVAQGAKEEWNYKHFWAPEVIKRDGKFYLYYTASPFDSPSNSGNRVGLAVADNIEGPYEDLGIVIPHASIDGNPFTDEDGQMYMYYTIEHGNKDGLKAGQIYVDKMTSLTSVEGKPRQILATYNWQEGPFVQNLDGTYIMTFSQGGWGDDTYNVRYAKSKSPMGPFVEAQNIIIKTNEMVKGPGHHFLFKDEVGGDWIVYHGWDKDFTARYPRIDPIVITPDTVYCNGPTYTPQQVKMVRKK